jgi:hypothetical protein
MMASISHNNRQMAAFSGFYQSPGPHLSGNVNGFVLAHRLHHQNGLQSWSIFLSSFHLLLAWWPLGLCGASSCLPE